MQDIQVKGMATLMKAYVEATPDKQRHIIKFARGEVEAFAQPVKGHEPRIFSRAEAAKLLGDKSTRFIDLLCRRGLLKKFTPRGNRRSIGVTAESFNQFLEGGGQ
jgi:hypothetical protein